MIGARGAGWSKALAGCLGSVVYVWAFVGCTVPQGTAAAGKAAEGRAEHLVEYFGLGDDLREAANSVVFASVPFGGHAGTAPSGVGKSCGPELPWCEHLAAAWPGGGFALTHSELLAQATVPGRSGSAVVVGRLSDGTALVLTAGHLLTQRAQCKGPPAERLFVVAGHRVQRRGQAMSEVSAAMRTRFVCLELLARNHIADDPHSPDDALFRAPSNPQAGGPDLPRPVPLWTGTMTAHEDYDARLCCHHHGRPLKCSSGTLRVRRDSAENPGGGMQLATAPSLAFPGCSGGGVFLQQGSGGEDGLFGWRLAAVVSESRPFVVGAGSARCKAMKLAKIDTLRRSRALIEQLQCGYRSVAVRPIGLRRLWGTDRLSWGVARARRP